MLVLGIETSCDETAAAVVEDGRRILSDVVHTQTTVHAPYGGVVPELASRDHLMRLPRIAREALARAGCALGDLGGVAVTSGPGLIGALLVGVQYAKSLAQGAGRPVVGVNHLEGHLLAIRLSERPPDFPFLGLLVSGGHTSLYEVRGFGEYRALGHTRDDAAGEAFDKTAKLLGLGYPGGVIVDRLAEKGDPQAVKLPRALLGEGHDFSFSGLKTAVLDFVRKNGVPQGQALHDLCASFQEAVVDVLVHKALAGARATGLRRLVLGGGVAANRRLRAVFAERAVAEGCDAYVPEKRLCTDNGAMIAVAGAWRLARGEDHGPAFNADAAWRI